MPGVVLARRSCRLTDDFGERAIHGDRGIVARRLRRSRVIEFFRERPSCVVGMKASATAK
jgi:hypothetical protein